MKRQPIQQFGMTRLLTDTAKIFQRLHNPRAEKLLPIAVHRCARSQRLPRHEEPFCQCQSIAGCASRKFWKQSGNVRREAGTCLSEKVSAFELPGISFFVRRLLQHHGSFHAANLLQSASQARKLRKSGVEVMVLDQR